MEENSNETDCFKEKMKEKSYEREDVDEEMKENSNMTEENEEMKENSDETDNIKEEIKETDLVSEESVMDDSSDDEEEMELEDGVELVEAPLSEEEIEELIADLLDVESKAAEAQEAIEPESLEKVEQEVRDELAEKLQGDELERTVADEMATLREEWETLLDELETESAHLLEQLDGAGVDLPSIYKWIESRAPNGCCTEAWKKRTHWVGSEITNDAVVSIQDAEKHLQTLRPVRRRHGKILEEGASVFLGKKVATGDSSENLTQKAEVDWSSFNKIFSQQSKEGISFGSEQWASVYLASTPQQAAAMGLEFPGVNEVEEIDDIDDDSSDPFVADAIANEKELVLTEEQKKYYRKVKEEDDLSVNRKLQLRLKRRRHRKRSKQGVREKAIESASNGDGPAQEFPIHAIEENICNGDSAEAEPISGSKHTGDEVEMDFDSKRSQMFMVDSDNEAQALKNDSDYIDRDDAIGAAESVEFDACPENVYDKFYCTACGKLTNDVRQHPLMKVIICGDCKCAVEAKIRLEDSELAKSYCGWCGRIDDLIKCRSCVRLFCKSCIKRNIGVEYSSEAKVYGWQCCCCSPNLLDQLTLELDKALRSRESTSSSSDSETDDTDDDIGLTISSKKTPNKKIRRILDDTELGEETKRKIALEKERQERLKSLKAQFSGISMMNMSRCSGSLPEGASCEVLGDASAGFIVNVVREKGEEAIRIPPSISAKLKTHQIAGIRFMWENIIQSIRNVRAGDKGLGCILAHTMGLGKTFQVIAFLYTAMRSVDLGLKTALIVAPVNVLHNWRQEFKKWEPKEFKPLRVYMLEDRPREQRAELLKKWRTKGGVFLIGYTAFRNLSFGKHVKDYQAAKEMCYSLQEGCDILVCDEAHMIKNTRADTTQALKQVKCQRRIALTGSPLQNNLMEYYCMVDFVREGFLGSMHEFRNRFQNPIENGQHANSTAEDVRIMNQRSHILYEQLKGFVQRMDMSVVKKDLPPKTVFVIAVKLSSLQRKLYKRFLDVHGFSDRAYGEGIRKRSFFPCYQTLAQICNHPWILQLTKERGYAKREDTVENFLPDASSSDENIDSNVVIGEKAKAKNEFTRKNDTNSFLVEGWWNGLLDRGSHREIVYSGKMVLLLDILTKCTELGDKALVFSQSIPTLDLIEYYLSKLPRLGKDGKRWKRGKDWYRIDGKTEGSERQKLVDAFNHPQNRRVKCTLISTRAGALGINLFAANRVIIVDGSWNPTNDLQAIYRAWRYGQKKPVFAYRLVAHGTMEEKIYKRQVKKEGLAARVVDRQQVHRSMSKEEILHLFEFSGDENLDIMPELAEKNGHMFDTNMGKKTVNLLKRNSSDCPESCSSDKLMEILLNRHRLRWITNYHEHETLLQENEEEKLTKEEQDLAWEVFRRGMEWQEVHRVPADESTFEQKQNTHSAPSNAQERSIMPEPVVIPRKRLPLRRCTNMSHLLTLRSQGIKLGCSTVCGECAQEISW